MDACPTCMGTGFDQNAPHRFTRKDSPQRVMLYRLRPCTDCDGHGVIDLRAGERDLLAAMT